MGVNLDRDFAGLFNPIRGKIMPDDLLDRITGAPAGSGDKLKEILDPKAGGDKSRLRNKLEKLWQAAGTQRDDESVERMNARNTALRLAKGAKPRRPDDDAIPRTERKARRQRSQAVPTYRVRGAGVDTQLSLCEQHRAKLKTERPELKVTVMAKRGKRCEACEYGQPRDKMSEELA